MKIWKYLSIIPAVISALICLISFSCAISPSVRIKDISSIQQARENQLMGFGLVVGLRQTGDSQQTEFTKQALTNLLSGMGLQAPSPISRSNTNPIYNYSDIPKNKEFKSKNVAAVMVTATLPAFLKPGQKIDVTVSSVGDATSLRGGTLLMTPLQGQDGAVYAVAQGSVSLGGASGGAGLLPMNRETTTAARIPNGAIVEKEVAVSIEEPLSSEYPEGKGYNESSTLSTLTVLLNQPDFTTASRVAYTIAKNGYDVRAQDASSIVIIVEPGEDLVSLISKVENLTVVPDVKAKIVVNERTGTVVIGENIRISPVAVSYGSFTVQIGNITLATDGTAGEGVSTANMRVKENVKKLSSVSSGSSLKDLITALNKLGAAPRDMIAILQAIKASGALNAEIEVI